MRISTPRVRAWLKTCTRAPTPAQSQNVTVVMSTISSSAPSQMTVSMQPRTSSALPASICAGAEITAALPTHSTG
jgi:hypothetical protein